ncbi:MAG: imelysin family protein [Rubrivivax sp.]
MIDRLRGCAAMAAVLMAVSCGGGVSGGSSGGTGGGGGGGGSAGNGGNPGGTPEQPTDDDARRAVLADLGDKLILPTLQQLEAQAAALAVAVDALAAAPSSDAARAAAQAAWRNTMALVQRAEVLQIGPAAAITEPGGLGLQMQLQAFPQFDTCAIHTAAYADQTVVAASPAERVGMGALEYVLFSDADDPACAPPAGTNGQAKRAQYAVRLGAHIGAVAAQLRMAWAPDGGNFAGQFKTAGAGSTVYATPQAALNAVSTAIFSFEKNTKDRKIAAPTGIGATDQPVCLRVSCPELLESRYARNSGANVLANLQAFRAVFTGADGGLGLNALLQGVGRADLVARFATALEAAAAAVQAGTQPDMETNVAEIPNRDACILASTSLSGAPTVCQMHGRIRAVTQILRAEIVSTLNLRIPDMSAGDND